MNSRNPVLYHSGHIQVLARRAYERSLADSSEAEVAIILAAVAIEGFLNEVAHAGSYHDSSPSIAGMRRLLLLGEDNNAQPRFKLHLIHFALTGYLLENDSSVMQDFDALIGLRNKLAHVKPVSVDWDFESEFTAPAIKEYPKPIRHLVNENIIAIPPSPHTWRHLVSDSNVAKWACNVTVQTMQAIAEWAPDGDFGELMRWFTSDMEFL